MEKIEKALEFRDVGKIYRRNHFFKTTETEALKGFSLDINRGEIFCLLGLNGAGKTTAVKLALNLIFPDSGDIKVLGEKPSPEVVSRVGYVSESPYLFPYLTARELFNLLGILSGLNSSRRAEAMDRICDFLSLGDFIDKKIGECSKGMQQRVLLAQALIHDPELLILDEPYSGLDPVGISQMRQYIEKLNAEGKTILMTSHLIAESEKIAARAGILKAGRIAKVIPVLPGLLEKEFLEAVL
ncbi:MAG: multidrug ABC transporter ATP-binding protein [Elusimicrobia bacterium HGW-Elusimicrobia-2]|nr:MAG: multidrug ABC transporter ATP-binding protein [Elusimicrobia bacterium HGW-Elusimicrobia-2]